MEDEIKYIRSKLDVIIDHVSDLKAEVKLLKYKSSIWGILGGGVVVAGALIIRKLGA